MVRPDRSSGSGASHSSASGAANGYELHVLDDGPGLSEEDRLKARQTPADLGAEWGVEPESAWGRLYTADGSAAVRSERGAWTTFYPAVAAAVRGRATPPVAPADAVATARVLDAARTSSAQGSVVRLAG